MGAEILGIIQAAAGAGAMAGSILVVSIIGRIEKAGLAILNAMFWIGGCFVIASFSSAACFGRFAFLPAIWQIRRFWRFQQGLLQTIAPPNMKGRIMGIWMTISFGLQPFGAILIGYLANAIGVTAAVLSFALALIAVAALMFVFRGGFRIWKPMPKEKGASDRV